MASSNIEQALYVYVSSSTAVADKVGKRIYLAKAETGTARPYVVYQTISDPHMPFAFGQPYSGQPRVQFSVFDDDRYNALTVAHVIRKRLRFYQGAMDGITVHNLTVGGTVLLPEPDQDIYQATFDVQPVYIDAS